MNLSRLLALVLLCSVPFNEVDAQYSLHKEYEVEDAELLKFDGVKYSGLVYDLEKQSSNVELYNNLGVTFSILSVFSLATGWALLNESRKSNTLSGGIAGELIGKTLLGIGVLNASFATVSFVISSKRKQKMVEL